MSSEPDFDWSQAASLLGEDPQDVPEEMAAIVRELVDTTTVRFQELKIRDLAANLKEIRGLAHQLRGSLLNFGFTGVGAVLWKIEKTEYTPEEYHAMLAEADTLFIASTKMLSEHYPSLRFS